MTTYFWTKDQLIRVFSEWNVEHQVPKKGKSVVVAWPDGKSMATVVIHNQKSTYGKTLYKVDLKLKGS